MKTTKTKTAQVPTRFGRETRFELTPKYHSFTTEQTQSTFQALKARLLEPVLENTVDPRVRRQINLAANEAAALAWTTPVPLLVLPVLLEEKAAEVEDYALRQEQVQQATQELELLA
jgi:hypothetical protein